MGDAYSREDFDLSEGLTNQEQKIYQLQIIFIVFINVMMWIMVNKYNLETAYM